MFTGIIQGSFNELAGRIPRLERVSASSNPSDYDTGRLKGVEATYKYPTNLSSEPNPNSVKSFENKTGRQYNPDTATVTKGDDYFRPPEQYDSYRLPRDPKYNFISNPFVTVSSGQQVTHLQEHLNEQKRLHPLREALSDLPGIFAKFKEKAGNDVKMLNKKRIMKTMRLMMTVMMMRDITKINYSWKIARQSVPR